MEITKINIRVHKSNAKSSITKSANQQPRKAEAVLLGHVTICLALVIQTRRTRMSPTAQVMEMWGSSTGVATQVIPGDRQG